MYEIASSFDIIPLGCKLLLLTLVNDMWSRIIQMTLDPQSLNKFLFSAAKFSVSVLCSSKNLEYIL